MSERSAGLSEKVPERPSLKFDDGPTVTLALAEEHDSTAATVRYDDERALGEGDVIQLERTNGGGPLGSATVEAAQTVPLEAALDVVDEHDARYGIEGVDELLTALNSYYDDTLSRSTAVTVLVLRPNLEASYADPPTTGGGLDG
jgi:hypothetical protein